MALSWNEIRHNAARFSVRWANAGQENAQKQIFLREFFYVFDVDFDELVDRGQKREEAKVYFEYKVPQAEGHKGFIDLLWYGKILVEMKSKDKDLDSALDQAYSYIKHLSPDKIPPLIMVSDFQNIWVNIREIGKTRRFKTKDLKDNVKCFANMLGHSTVEPDSIESDIDVNINASKKLAKLHDIWKNYGYDLHSLEYYLVRILFCLFAESTDIFEHNSFRDYIEAASAENLPMKIQQLFEILNMSNDERVKKQYLTADLLQFPYVNGGLFKTRLDMPPFDEKMRKTLIECTHFNWSKISPAIFGAMFQGVMDDKLRKQMGAHYTSEENILRIIKPLFLDDLWNEFEHVKYDKRKLKRFHEKIASLKFLDPACGCGNFLIITYRELRKLEYEILKMTKEDNQRDLAITDGFSLLFKVNINQFYGIELEEFPCRIAQVGMWLMEHQMNMLAKDKLKLGESLVDLPLKSSATIIQNNALTLDWNSVVPNTELNYIIGNPPFVGKKERTPQQTQDMEKVFYDYEKFRTLDYVSAWYKKSAEYINGTAIEVAFVSTNSIMHGEQTSTLWKPLIERYNITINFAYEKFKWGNEAPDEALVYCVIIGFAQKSTKKEKFIFEYNDNLKKWEKIKVNNISPYLVDMPSILISSRTNVLSKNAPITQYGNMPIDDGHLILSDEERKEFIEKEPITASFIKRFGGGEEIITNSARWCLWLEDINPADIKKSKLTENRIAQTRAFREQSKRAATRSLAMQSHLFGEIRQPKTPYIAIPKVTSGNRLYIPLIFATPEVIMNGSTIIVPDASLYHFGVLSSIVHMAWIDVIGGRYGPSYQYSINILYNNFPWPTPTEEQKLAIEKAAQTVLIVRDSYKESSLVDLYNPLFMQKDLLEAHEKLDRAVIKAYNKKWKTESEIVSDLMKMYEVLVNKEAKELAEKAKIKGKRGRKRKSDA